MDRPTPYDASDSAKVTQAIDTVTLMHFDNDVTVSPRTSQAIESMSPKQSLCNAVLSPQMPQVIETLVLQSDSGLAPSAKDTQAIEKMPLSIAPENDFVSLQPHLLEEIAMLHFPKANESQINDSIKKRANRLKQYRKRTLYFTPSRRPSLSVQQVPAIKAHFHDLEDAVDGLSATQTEAEDKLVSLVEDFKAAIKNLLYTHQQQNLFSPVTDRKVTVKNLEKVLKKMLLQCIRKPTL